MEKPTRKGALVHVAEDNQSFHETPKLAPDEIVDTSNATSAIVNNDKRVTGRQRIAAQNAAGAALIFAQRRGADSQRESESKPFNFKNETGMCIAYVSQIPDNYNKDVSLFDWKLI